MGRARTRRLADGSRQGGVLQNAGVSVVRWVGLNPICQLKMKSARFQLMMFESRLLWVALLSGWLSLPALALPHLSNYSPRFAPPGATVTLTGTGLGTVTSVNFNGAPASIKAVSATAIQVIVPPNAVIGAIYIRDNQGFTDDTGSAGLLDFLASPRIATVKRILPPADSPAEEVRIGPGNTLEIIGANYLSFTDSMFADLVRVDFTGPNGPLRVIPNTVGTTVLQVDVPAGTVSGPVTVVTPVGSAKSIGDLYVQPAITHFPAAAAVGQIIEIVGTNFKGAKEVDFGDMAVAPLTVSNTNLTVKVPPITAPVLLTIITPGGAILTGSMFSLAPTLNAFTPAGGSVGTAVTLTGTGLSGATKIRFGTVDAAIVSATAMEAKTLVPRGALTGPITLITPVGTNTTTTKFFLPPLVTGVTPNRGKPGTTLTISGSSLTGTTQVLFAGVPGEFQILSDTALKVTVPEDALSGSLSVTNPGGTASGSLNFTVLGRQPIVDAFSPDGGAAGTLVTLTGINFIGTTGIQFSNAPASSFTVKSDTNLVVTVPAGARSGPIAVKNALGTGFSPRSFTVGTNASLSLTLSANPVSVLSGEPLVLNLEVKNQGPLAAAGSTVTVTLPEGLDYVDGTVLSGNITLLVDGLLWNVGSVGVNQSVLGYLRVQPRFVGTFPVTVQAATATPDPVSSDNQGSINVFAVLPKLSFRGKDGPGIILGWPIHAVDYAVQGTPSLTSPNWTIIPNTPVEFQDEFRVVVPATSAAYWYRLAPR